MQVTSGSLARRIGGFFAVDDPWARPGGLTRSDVVVGLITWVFAAVTLELTRSVGALESTDQPRWLQWTAITVGAGILVVRRRWPLTVALLATAHMFVVGVTMPEVMAQITMQVVYFIAFLSAVAWARSRRDLVLVMTGVIIFMFAWLAWEFALGSGLDDMRHSLGEDADADFGLVSPVKAGVLLTALLNLVYFGGAIAMGQVSWNAARRHAQLAQTAQLLQDAGEGLRRRAVLEERLRIARELHDVVAHHVSVIGIHAAAGRRVLSRDPAGAERALQQIEQSSREAVGQMRGLLGTLRGGDPPDPEATAGGRTPEPGLAELADLVFGAAAPGFTTDYQVVEHPSGTAQQVPAPLALSVYRTVQEALANVRRHSTATRVGVVVRVERTEDVPYVEVEIVDDGRPRRGTSGTGLGQLGIRERAASHHGEVELGPRATGGYRVRVRLPLLHLEPPETPGTPVGEGPA